MPVTPDACPADISDQDVLEAMKQIPGYIDITPADFRAIYVSAYHHALERMRNSVRAQDIMTRGVVAVRADTPLAEVAAVLGRHRISGAPVVDAQGRVAGVISEKDFLPLMGAARGDSFMAVVAGCLKGKGCPAISARRQTAAELMSAPAVTVSEEATVSEISALMARKGINRLPVTDPAGRLVGIVTRASVVLSACAAPA
jgi:CBS-domain-containing membrane protein